MRGKKPTSGLLAMGSAAVVAIYSAGFLKTRDAATLQARLVRPAAPEAPRAPDAPDAPDAPNAPKLKHRPTIAPAAPAAPDPPTLKHRPTNAPAAPRPAAPEMPTLKRRPTKSPAAPIAPDAPAPVAPVTPEPPATPTAVEEKPLRDGTYVGWGTSPHGDIAASVTIADGKITAVSIAQCRTQYSCDILSKLPGQVLKKQSPDVDAISGATHSVNAFYWAVWDALRIARES